MLNINETVILYNQVVKSQVQAKFELTTFTLPPYL